ncbi:MAG TPA: hypothetical protein VHG29_06720 [Novosphingobium sp.]|nr:hypothetical protein [Novosphingobium sp.]
MDRPAIKRVLIAAALVSLAGAGSQAPTLRAARWTTPDHLVEALTIEPGECLAPPEPGTPQADRIAIGRAAFRAPLLLGGQAARIGLSCNSCHRSGRGNAAFTFPGLSGALGTADVTTSVLSSHRGDGVFNPLPIPDLSGLRAGLKVDQSIVARKLEPFIRGQIMEEFDGPEPTAATLDGLAAYVRALDPARCGTPQPITLTRDLQRIDGALETATRLTAAGDGATALVLVASARSGLGLIDERYSAGRLRRAAAGLRSAAIELGRIERLLPGGPAAARARIEHWLRDSERWRPALRRTEAASLYNPALLSAASTAPTGRT